MTSAYNKPTDRHANFTVWPFDVRNIPTQTISKIKYHVTENKFNKEKPKPFVSQQLIINFRVWASNHNQCNQRHWDLYLSEASLWWTKYLSVVRVIQFSSQNITSLGVIQYYFVRCEPVVLINTISHRERLSTVQSATILISWSPFV